jgi:hypothetical protein
VLGDISEVDVMKCLFQQRSKIHFSVIDKHPNGANKPRTAPVKQIWGGHNLTDLPHNLQDWERKTRSRRGHEETPFYSIPTIVNRCLLTKETFGPTILRNGKFNNSDNMMVKVYSDRTAIRKELKSVIIGDS